MAVPCCLFWLGSCLLCIWYQTLSSPQAWLVMGSDKFNFYEGYMSWFFLGNVCVCKIFSPSFLVTLVLPKWEGRHILWRNQWEMRSRRHRLGGAGSGQQSAPLQVLDSLREWHQYWISTKATTVGASWGDCCVSPTLTIVSFTGSLWEAQCKQSWTFPHTGSLIL